MSDIKKVEISEKSYVLDDFFKVEEVFLKHQKYDGSMSASMRRLNFERGDSVAVLLKNTDTGCFILTEQFRYPAHSKTQDGWIVEAIAGSLKPSEDPAKAMKREILEEVGYQASELQFLHTFFVSPGGTSERIHLFYGEVASAQQVEAGGGLEQEHEDIKIIEWTEEEAQNALQTGKVVDAKTLIAFQWYFANHS